MTDPLPGPFQPGDVLTAEEMNEIVTYVRHMTNNIGPTGPTGPSGPAGSLGPTGPTGSSGASSYDIGRNKLHNPMFQAQQRGAGPWTANGYGPDRWLFALVNDVINVTVVTLDDIARGGIGDEEARWALSNSFSGNGAAGSYNIIAQRIERVWRLSGKTVTVSFWARCTAGTLNLGVNLSQNFGTGGSPSTAAWIPTGLSVTLNTLWTRYNVTFAVPSATGMTLGTNGDDFTQLGFWCSSGSTFNTIAGSIGVQSGTIQLWGVQLEVGSDATPFEKIDLQINAANCRRFYQTMQAFAIGFNNSGGGIWGTYFLPVVMRANPATTITGATYANASALVIYNASTTTLVMQATVTASGQASGAGTVALSADL